MCPSPGLAALEQAEAVSKPSVTFRVTAYRRACVSDPRVLTAEEMYRRTIAVSTELVILGSKCSIYEPSAPITACGEVPCNQRWQLQAAQGRDMPAEEGAR